MSEAGMSAAAITEALWQWRAAPPQATQASWDEIEAEGQRQLAGLQAAWMGQLAGATRAGATGPICPDCGVARRPGGQRPRQILTRRGRTVPLERPYDVGPAGGAGVFPPG